MRLPCVSAALSLLSFFGSAALSQGLPLHHAPAPTVPAITAGDLMTRLYIFADDSMQGREAGTPGNVRATSYIASEVRRLGLIPAGDSGTYFQTIPLALRRFDTTSTFLVGGVRLLPYLDYVVRAPGLTATLQAIYGGLAGESPPLAARDAAGKLVVFTVRGGPGTFRSLRGVQAPGAAAVALVALDSLPATSLATLREPRAFLNDAPPGAPQAPPLFLLTARAAAMLFLEPLSHLAPGAAGVMASVDVRFRTEPVPSPARNVVAVLQGSDPALRGEYVALGAHSDHLGIAHPVDHDSVRLFNEVVRPEGADDASKQPTTAEAARVDSLLAAYRSVHPGSSRIDSIYNGADDDGSGSVALLEIAEQLAGAENRPRRSVLFVWHTAEEKGLFGSRYFTDHPSVPRDSIVAQLNLDMVGRGDADDETARTKEAVPIHGGPSFLLLVGTRRLSSELGELIERVNADDHHGLALDYTLDADGHPSNIYCRSDQYEYARYGIPIAFFTTGLHRDYHQVTDEPEYIDYEHLARVARFVDDVAVHIANLDHRLVVDHPSPGPNAACRQ